MSIGTSNVLIGMEALHKSMTSYMKSLSKRAELEDKQKILPVGYLGQTMSRHGEDFEPDSEFGNCLISKSIGTCVVAYLTSSRHGKSERTHRSSSRNIRCQRYSGMDGIPGAFIGYDEGI